MREVKTYYTIAVPVAGKVDGVSSVGHVGGSGVDRWLFFVDEG
jgi:hypothetical protein